jgi:hypothetical protein
MSSHEFRENAEECIGWAKTARSNREREIFLQMAEAWHVAAFRAEIREQAMTTELAPSLSSLAHAKTLLTDFAKTCTTARTVQTNPISPKT